jgi:DNA-binding NtrC family response regulator
MVIMSDEAITEADLPPYLTSDPHSRVTSKPQAGGGGSVDVVQYGNSSLREFRELVETAFIRHKLDQFEWNISRTAQALGIERTNLHKRMRALGIHRER